MKVIKPQVGPKNVPDQDHLIIGVCQMAPIFLNRQATLDKAIDQIELAAKEGCELITFGEALVPGYPFWLALTDAARFNDDKQKAIHSLYLEQGVTIERGDLADVQAAAKRNKIAIYLGIMERALDRGGHTLYCSLVYIDNQGQIASVHRKLHPTYEERLAWGSGDGHGLRTHSLGAFTLGGLNCFENWMPLSRAALYAQGENLHIGVWPGGLHNTYDLTQVLAKEGRSYVVACSGLMRKSDCPADMPSLEEILDNSGEFMANGGSCIANPDGTWLIEPVIEEEALLVAEIDHAKVRQERQNFDLAGHYSRPDVTRLVVNRQRQGLATFEDE
ncbi:carbon-nitrogen hydrolase family protein [Cohaesibacter gelatinilyticus]|uniref:Nitrilase n=1 Tax=Cohaesibacter gelatinilyticus TaxID=372072 RepID=A0A285NE61_9HYPH|nr:carbon-nitrogen hydrolase family protein [Cohaesibacter gelatinilyticus]SNZ06216.1 nitrilase [Cohaesibacter gelatinilyticus]